MSARRRPASMLFIRRLREQLEVMELHLDPCVVRESDPGIGRLDLRVDPLVERRDLLVLSGDVPVDAPAVTHRVPWRKAVLSAIQPLLAEKRLQFDRGEM